MPNAVIVDAVRTPVGRRNGVFKNYHPVDLASRPLEALVERNGIDQRLIDDVIMGSSQPDRGTAYNVGRNAALAAGYPEEVPESPSTANVVPPSSRPISSRRTSWPGLRMWSSPPVWRT